MYCNYIPPPPVYCDTTACVKAACNSAAFTAQQCATQTVLDSSRNAYFSNMTNPYAWANKRGTSPYLAEPRVRRTELPSWPSTRTQDQTRNLLSSIPTNPIRFRTIQAGDLAFRFHLPYRVATPGDKAYDGLATARSTQLGATQSRPESRRGDYSKSHEDSPHWDDLLMTKMAAAPTASASRSSKQTQGQTRRHVIR